MLHVYFCFSSNFFCFFFCCCCVYCKCEAATKRCQMISLVLYRPRLVVIIGVAFGVCVKSPITNLKLATFTFFFENLKFENIRLFHQLFIGNVFIVEVSSLIVISSSSSPLFHPNRMKTSPNIMTSSSIFAHFNDLLSSLFNFSLWFFRHGKTFCNVKMSSRAVWT